VFDCHVNRSPVTGRIEKIAYRPGAFINADLDKASEDNERNCFKISTTGGAQVGVVQIAGLIARRIVCTASAGQEVVAGQRFGLIRFGSRTDLYLPLGWASLVIPGQRVIGGETVVADSQSQEPPRRGLTH
jgi:phosphatidylserine decarboxylase